MKGRGGELPRGRGRRGARAGAGPGSASPGAARLRLRQGRPAAMPTLRNLILEERMNPLFLQAERFIVGVEDAGAGEGQLLGGGQIRAIGPPDGGAGEVASVVVRAGSRGQGIGGRILDELLRRNTDGFSSLFVLTTGDRRSVDFYRRRGFEVVDTASVPAAMRVEQALGSLVARLARGESCVAMRLGRLPAD